MKNGKFTFFLGLFVQYLLICLFQAEAMRKGMELESPSDGIRLQEEVRSREEGWIGVHEEGIEPRRMV